MLTPRPSRELSSSSRSLKTYPQAEVWGGLIFCTGDQFAKLSNATINFAQNVTDPKASMLTAFNVLAGVVCSDPLPFIIPIALT